MEPAALSQGALASEARTGLCAWLGQPPGRFLLEAEVSEINRVLPDLFGYQLVQVGRMGDTDLLSRSRVLNRSVMDVDGAPGTPGYPRVVGHAGALPLETDSIDVILLPHVLEFEARPHDALREAHRALVAEGHLVITGFNPWSMMGAWRLARGRRGQAPWNGRFLGLNRLRDWLELLGFDVRRIRSYFFRPPLGHEGLMRRLGGLESAGRRVWPYLAGGYLVLARKRVVTVTPIRPRWRPRRRLVSVGLAEPSTRVASRGR